MTIKKLDHVSVVVDDLPAAIAFFTTLGMALEGKALVEGPWVDRVNALEGVQVDIVMMRTPDGHGRLELTRFRHPELVEIDEEDFLVLQGQRGREVHGRRGLAHATLLIRDRHRPGHPPTLPSLPHGTARALPASLPGASSQNKQGRGKDKEKCFTWNVFISDCKYIR